MFAQVSRRLVGRAREPGRPALCDWLLECRTCPVTLVRSGDLHAAVNSRCATTPDQEEGPYYRELELIREDIAEGRPGSPLTLDLRVLDSSCSPIAGALVDVWHCDALGVYSWYAAAEEEEIGPALLAPGTFLRGSGRTGAQGRCRFRTIYPGWYPGRTVHIHGKVHDESKTLTVQLYFPEEVTDRVHGGAPYDQRPRRDTTNESDTIFPSGGQTTMLDLSAEANGHIADGTLVLD